jgi:hypothetical protein
MNDAPAPRNPSPRDNGFPRRWLVLIGMKLVVLALAVFVTLRLYGLI